MHGIPRAITLGELMGKQKRGNMENQAESTEDAADTLAAYEAHLHAERERWKKAQPQKIVGCMWFEPLTEQDRAERAQQIAAGILPF